MHGERGPLMMSVGGRSRLMPCPSHAAKSSRSLRRSLQRPTALFIKCVERKGYMFIAGADATEDGYRKRYGVKKPERDGA